MKVKAKMLGFYGDVRRREGDVFEIKDDSQFSKVWMERVDAPEPAPTAPEEEYQDSEPVGDTV